MVASRTLALDRATRIRRLWWMLAIGVLITVTAIVLGYFGIDAISVNVFPHAIILLPLGIGTVAAATTGLLALRRFSLRGLSIGIACCGLLCAAWTYRAQPWLEQRLSYNDANVKLSYSPPTPSAQIATAPGFVWVTREVYVVFPVVSSLVAVTVIALLPFLTLPLILRWRVPKSVTPGPSESVGT